MGNVLDKSCREMKTYILCSVTFSENCTVMSNSEKYGGYWAATNDVTV